MKQNKLHEVIGCMISAGRDDLAMVLSEIRSPEELIADAVFNIGQSVGALNQLLYMDKRKKVVDLPRSTSGGLSKIVKALSGLSENLSRITVTQVTSEDTKPEDHPEYIKIKKDAEKGRGDGGPMNAPGPGSVPA